MSIIIYSILFSPFFTRTQLVGNFLVWCVGMCLVTYDIPRKKNEPWYVSLALDMRDHFTSLNHSQPNGETQYLALIRDILKTGVQRGDRTGTGTLSKFGVQMRFDLERDGFPLLTTKRVWFKGVAKELLWMLRGSTDARELAAEGVKIWDANGSREFLDKAGFPGRRVGDLGPIYGWQWRKFGAPYQKLDDYPPPLDSIDEEPKEPKEPKETKETKEEDATSATIEIKTKTEIGVDQIKVIIQTILVNPNSRRIILCAWNVADLRKMALPPCHVLAQFFVSRGRLSCHLYQRSGDMGLGVPFNIASYALLTSLIAHVCGLKPGEFIHTIGDAHIYLNHVDALERQIQRTPRKFPTLTINPELTDIDKVAFKDLGIKKYYPHPKIAMKMAV